MSEPLPLAEIDAWVQRADCGAVVTFTGNVRDHSPGRPGVSELTYEAYEGEVERRLGAIAADIRRRWPDVGRLAMLHRSGTLAVGECAVVVAVGAPHRDTAFEACRWGIDTLKATVPIWKRERWNDGDDWGLDGVPPVAVGGTENA